MSNFKIINPGLPKLFGLSDMTYIANNTYNPINGVSFNTFSSDRRQICLFPACEEIWIKAGLYFTDFLISNNNSAEELTIGAGSSGLGVCVYKDTLCLFNKGTYYTNSALTYRLSAQVYYNILFHAQSGSNGYIEAFVDGKRTGILHDQIAINNTLYMRNRHVSDYKCYLSNIIISNTEIKPTEEVYILDAKQTETDMTETSDSDNPHIYTATSPEQTLLQTVDADALATKIGTNKLRVTGIGVGANPIYYEGEDLTNVAFMVNDEEKEVAQLTTNTDGGLTFGCEADLSFNDLQTLKLGWKAKQ